MSRKNSTSSNLSFRSDSSERFGEDEGLRLSRTRGDVDIEECL